MKINKFYRRLSTASKCEICDNSYSVGVCFCDSEIKWLQKRCRSEKDIKSFLTSGIGTVVCSECKRKRGR